MKSLDLPRFLEEKKVPPHFYSLDGGGDDEIIGIFCEQDRWTVYSVSRGTRNILLETESEDSAVEKFLYYLSKNLKAYGIEIE